MPDDVSQATPSEPVTPGSTQVQETITPTQGNPPAEPQTETPLTREQLQELIRTEATKIAQSYVAKGENRIQKLIADRFNALEQTKSALNLSDEQVAQAKQKIVSEAFSSKEEPPTTQPTDESLTADDAIQFMNTQIGSVFARVGQTVTRSDPEFPELQKAIDDSWNDPDGLAVIVLAASKAATSKATRLQTQQQTAAGRVTAGGVQTGGQAPQPKSAHAAWDVAYKKQ